MCDPKNLTQPPLVASTSLFIIMSDSYTLPHHIGTDWFIFLQTLWEQEADLSCLHWMSQCLPTGDASRTSFKRMNTCVHECWTTVENEKNQTWGLG